MTKSYYKKILNKVIFELSVIFVATSIIAKYKKKNSVYENEPEQKNPLQGKKVVFVEDKHDKKNADGIQGHLKAVGNSNYKPGVYGRYIKRLLDIILSFVSLVILLPVYAFIALAIVIDDPGPVIFTQKRLGKNKEYFKLHKFRTMKMCTPHDVPTHMLENPEQYITKVGKFLRTHSLDELPQIWDIFIGNMSVVGPRPGLWNQDLLTAERDKYNANDIKPGLTGWAQINGRDELEISMKAKLDGEYVQKIGIKMDIKCFFGSIGVFAHDDSIIEGSCIKTKKIGRSYTDGKLDSELIGHIGFGEPVKIEHFSHKYILIIGVNSYIGESFKSYAEEHYHNNFSINTVNTLDDSWKKINFSSYDIIYHVAGIAHADIEKVNDITKERYYSINTDLAIEVAKKAKAEGVKEFIFMSSMIIYGESSSYGKKNVINACTVPVPSNFYGDSKLQADVGLRGLADKTFKVIILRPPMIYGKGSKGNYPMLVKVSKILPIFPDINNERSMLYIDNFCEFLCQIMLVGEFRENAIVLFPQNMEWTKTSEMVRKIAYVSGKNIKKLSILIPVVYLAGKIPGRIGRLVNKAFGNSCYAHEISKYEGIDYQIVSLDESIERIEKNG